MEMESTYLKTFVEVVHCGSFSKAAKTLAVTQSAVSRRIKFIEDQYGTILLDRSGPLLCPTEAGRLVNEKARHILEIEGELVNELHRMNVRPPVRFACTRPFGIAFLPAIMKKLIGRYEGKFDFTLCFETPSEALEGLREKRHDIIVIEHWDEIDFTPYDTISLGADEMIFISSPSLGLPAPLISVDELVCQRLYRRKKDCCSGRMLSSNMAAIGRDPNEFDNMMLYDDLHIIIESVCAGEGIAFISRSIVASQIEDGKLIEHKVGGFCHSRRRTLAYQNNNRHNQLIHDFITCMSDEFEEFEVGILRNNLTTRSDTLDAPQCHVCQEVKPPNCIV